MSETAARQVTCMDCCGRGVVSLWGKKDQTASEPSDWSWIDKRCDRCQGTGKLPLYSGSVEKH